MYQLTKVGRNIADCLEGEPNTYPKLSSLQKLCLKWLRLEIGPKLLDMAIEVEITNPLIPDILKQLLDQGLVTGTKEAYGS